MCTEANGTPGLMTLSLDLGRSLWCSGVCAVSEPLKVKGDTILLRDMRELPPIAGYIWVETVTWTLNYDVSISLSGYEGRNPPILWKCLQQPISKRVPDLTR